MRPAADADRALHVHQLTPLAKTANEQAPDIAAKNPRYAAIDYSLTKGEFDDSISFMVIIVVVDGTTFVDDTLDMPFRNKFRCPCHAQCQYRG